jgi:hypothetical protein
VEPDFRVKSEYSVARRIFEGELTRTAAFIGGLVRIEPMDRVYRNPKFTPQTIVVATVMLQHARKVPTTYGAEQPAVGWQATPS